MAAESCSPAGGWERTSAEVQWAAAQMVIQGFSDGQRTCGAGYSYNDYNSQDEESCCFCRSTALVPSVINCTWFSSKISQARFNTALFWALDCEGISKIGTLPAVNCQIQ